MTVKNQVSNIPELYDAMIYDNVEDNFSLAKKWLKRMNTLKYFCGEKLETISECGKEKLETLRDPYTDEILASILPSQEDDIKKILFSSTSALSFWSVLKPSKRRQYICGLARKLEELKDGLAQVESLSVGAPLSETKFEVSRICSYLHYYASTAVLLRKTDNENSGGIVIVYLEKSTPIFSLAATVAPALAVGHVVVLIPSLQTPLTCFQFAEVCIAAGMPSGTVNVIPGSLELVRNFVMHSEKVKRLVTWHGNSSSQNICSDLETITCPVIPFNYGKSLAIIFESSDLLSACEILLKNMKFGCQQIPWAVRTILVEEAVYTSFVSVLKKKTLSFKVGGFHDKGVDIGLPKKCDAITSVAVNNALDHFVQRGIEVFQVPIDDALFFPPTFIIGSDAEMNCILKDSDVLPFVSILPFRNSKEAIEFANKNQFGVAVSLWTSCLSLAMYMTSNLEVNTVWINNHGILDPSIPFSDRKHGLGCIGSQIGLQPFLPCEKILTCNVEADEEKECYQKPILKEYFAHYGGTYKPTVDGSSYSILLPNGFHFRIHDTERVDVKKAVGTARVAQQKWWKLSSSARAAVLLNVADKFQDVSKSFLQYMEDCPQIEKELENIHNHFYKWAFKCNNTVSFKIDNPVPNYQVQILQEPIGVIGILMEDNTSFEAFALLVMSALSFGNSVVVVPNYRNPVPALEFCALFATSKAPSGLLNVVLGSKSTLYSELVFHRDVHRIWYFGNDANSMNTLTKMANEVKKCVLTFSCTDTLKSKTDFQFVATYPKAVWFPCENISC